MESCYLIILHFQLLNCKREFSATVHICESPYKASYRIGLLVVLPCGVLSSLAKGRGNCGQIVVLQIKINLLILKKKTGRQPFHKYKADEL